MNRNHQKTVLLLVVGLAVLVATRTTGQTGSAGAPATGQRGGAHRIGVLDLVRVFNECAQIKGLNEVMRQKNDELAKEAQQRREVIENKQMQLTAFKPGSSDFEARRKELVRLNIEANVWLQTSEQDLERQKFDWTRIIYEKAVKVAGEIAGEQGYDLVLLRGEFKPHEIEQTVQTLRRVIQNRAVVYHTPEIDVTDRVIRRLDSAYKAAGGKTQLQPTGAPMP